MDGVSRAADEYRDRVRHRRQVAERDAARLHRWAKLVVGSAIGLVTTHDLELTRMVDRLGKPAANVHFVDAVVDGEIRFDYKMWSGVVKTSNALLLMRKVGLDV